jgi:flagellar M-ring protein FliF
MTQFLRIWKSLSQAQRISLVLVPVLLAGISAGVLKWKHNADFRTLYSSLAPEDASAVITKIKEAGIEYKLDEAGATVFVPAAKLAEARLALAGSGMPRSGRIGFELFDRTNLGASDFTEQVNYQRALEGELERTVATLAEVEQARIHITAGKESVFLDSRQSAKATVVLKLRNASHIQQDSVTAIANLMASAVDGLAPDSVSIIDSSGRLLNRPRTGDGDARTAEAGLDYRQQLESELQAKLGSALEPVLGPGRFRTGVSVDCDFTSVDQSDEIYDSAKSATLTSQVTEESTGSGITGGTPGTASNLPQPPPKAVGTSSGIVRRTENVSYQPSRTIRHTVNPRGTVRKISTVVLVDHTIRWEGTGAKARKTILAPSPEVLKAVHDVAAGIVAYNEQRGDQITVAALPFETTVEAEPPLGTMPSSGKRTPDSDTRQLLYLGGAAVAVIVMLAAAVFMMRRKAVSATDTSLPAIPAESAATRPTTSEAVEKNLQDEQQSKIESEIMTRIKLPAANKTTEMLIRHVRENAQKDPEASANVLRSWMVDPEGKAV